MHGAVMVDVNMSQRNQATQQTTTNGMQVKELVHQIDHLSTKHGGQHPYPDSRQCSKCGQSGHLASKCGVKCSACGRWGHLAEACRSKPSMDTPKATHNTTDPRPARGNRPRPTCDFCGKLGHIKDQNLDGSNFRRRNGNGSASNQGN